ncbi:hypothetical protein [Streptomyces palmae]|uniref:ApeI dehydratase-like domain-containing protein n=1 Tax=Streptomyces palmae TaxID=1701085 RepID=A0A4Z0HJL0_9ACTN|nr:hypothetical protein [Streptomyces palmae]TGB19329.1 hypothetical protein E4099_00395 [Streptomyces palmae]
MISDETARTVFGEVEILSAGDQADGQPPQATARVVVGADEPAFDGHYRGFAILPGVCLIELAHRTAMAALPPAPAAGRARLAAVEAARFQDPVFPGEAVTVELKWERTEDGWRCRTVLSTERGPSARVRLAYEWGESA